MATRHEYLKTSRVRLRQYQNEDFESLMELNSDPEVMRYLTNGVPGTREENQAGADRTLFYQKKYNGKLGLFIAELNDTGEFIGWFHLRPAKTDLENTKVLELGYRLKKKFWGRAYATEVSQALIELAFQKLNGESVFAQTASKNMSSRRVMEKVGMTFETEFIDEKVDLLGPSVLYRIKK